MINLSKVLFLSFFFISFNSYSSSDMDKINGFLKNSEASISQNDTIEQKKEIVASKEISRYFNWGFSAGDDLRSVLEKWIKQANWNHLAWEYQGKNIVFDTPFSTNQPTIELAITDLMSQLPDSAQIRAEIGRANKTIIIKQGGR